MNLKSFHKLSIVRVGLIGLKIFSPFKPTESWYKVSQPTSASAEDHFTTEYLNIYIVKWENGEMDGIYLAKCFQRTIDQIIAWELACILCGHQHHLNVILIFHRQSIPKRIKHRCIQRMDILKGICCRITIWECDNQRNKKCSGLHNEIHIKLFCLLKAKKKTIFFP